MSECASENCSKSGSFRKRILVFPCGSEIGLEIYRSIHDDFHFDLIGATSVADHGTFVYDKVIEDLPWLSDERLLPTLQTVVKELQIDLIYPANDMTLAYMRRHEESLNCAIVAPSLEAVETCLSKKKTYAACKGAVRLPKTWEIHDVKRFPVFAKPDVGHSSIGARLINSSEELLHYAAEFPDAVFCEYLPGREYTVDCFSDKDGRLLYSGARVRARRTNGISVGTHLVDRQQDAWFREQAECINAAIGFTGAWFFQMKESESGEPVLMEVAARFGGSSSLNRARGVNFALLSVWTALGKAVSVIANDFSVSMDRALDNRFKFDFKYDEVFLDYDDTLVMTERDGSVNAELLRFIYQCFNRKIRITLVTRHAGDLFAELKAKRLDRLFDRIFHLKNGERKSSFIDNPKSIFIDDSFAERAEVLENCKIPVFGLDMVAAL